MKFEHLFSPMQVGKVTYRNRIVSAPMAFGLIVQNPDARDFTYRKLEASAKGGNGCVIVGETDVNFTDAVRIPGFRPFDFTKPEEDPETFDAVGEYARRIKRHGAVALAELVHCGKEKVPFGPGQEAIGPIETTNLAGVRVRPMNEDDMARIARDFAVSATYMQKAGFDGVLIHGGHGFLFTQFLSPLMNTRTDSYGGSLENRARFPLQILKAVREAVGPDFLVELRIDGTDHQPGGITPEETGAFVAMAEPYITSVHVTCGIYEASVKSGTESSMFHPHGLNIDNAAIIKTYTKLPVGAVGGINSPELCEQAIAEGKIDFAILGRQMLADPEFANKARSGHEDQIRRCLRCYKCFPGSPARRAMTICPSPARSWPSTWATAPSTPWPTCPSIPTPWPPPPSRRPCSSWAAAQPACRPPSPPATGARRSSWPSRAPAWAVCCGSPTWTPTSPT